MSHDWKIFALSAVIALGALATSGSAHEGDFFVGRNGANQLVVEFDFNETLPLEFVDGVLEGCAFDEPGFANLDVDEPDEDFYMLDPSSVIVFEVVSVDPAFSGWTPGFADRMDAPSDQWSIGSPPFDEHLVWHADSTHGSFDAGTVYSMTFRLLDTGPTGYGASEEYTVMFQCAARGACCIDGECESEFEDLCGDEGGVYFGDGTECLGSADGDAVDDRCDNCPNAANDEQADSDGDGAGDVCDGCPMDPAKLSPGLCGCGTSDADSDGDTVPDCGDQCPGEDDLLDANGNQQPDCTETGAIPTMSEWGLVILALLLLAFAKAQFGREAGQGGLTT